MRSKKRIGVMIPLMLCVMLLMACSGGKEKEKDAVEREEERTEPEKEEQEPSEETEETVTLSLAEEQLRNMTVEEKTAQLFFITPEALTGVDQVVCAGNTTKECLEKYPVGGLIYFTSNIKSRDQIRQMLTDSEQYMQELGKVPLFLGIDEEGGTVVRAAASGIEGIPKVGNMSEIGASKDSEKALETGQVLGTYLTELGFNMDFAPVADVLTNPENAVVKYRSFGSDKEIVSEMVNRELTGMHQSGLLGVVKHFPGHGATAGDTHQGYAYTEKTLEEMMENELVPFRRAIENGVQLIMVGHISVPGITGTGEPSSLSYRVITELLRENLDYQGIVITDAMNMKAISDNYSSAQAAVKVIQAGGDMILMPADFKSAYQGILNAVHSGEITEERLDESVRRILNVKETMRKEKD